MHLLASEFPDRPFLMLLSLLAPLLVSKHRVHLFLQGRGPVEFYILRLPPLNRTLAPLCARRVPIILLRRP